MLYPGRNRLFTRISTTTIAAVFALSSLASAAMPIFLIQTAYAVGDPGSIMINEVMADPSVGNEWIELYSTADTDIDVSKWTIDGFGNIPPNSIVQAHSLLVVPNTGKNSALNNDGETLVLRSGNGAGATEIDRLTFPALAKGESYGRSPNGSTTLRKFTPAQVTEEKSNYIQPLVTATSFNTHSGTDYKGINVGFTLNDGFRAVSAVKVELYAGNTVIATNTHNQELLNLINVGREKSLSTPFITTSGTYTEEYWNLGAFTGTKNTLPTKAVISVTDAFDTVSATANLFTEANGWTYESLLPDTTAPTVSNIAISPQVNKAIGRTVTVTFDITDETGVDLTKTRMLFADGPNTTNQLKESAKYTPVLVDGNTYEITVDTTAFVKQNYTGTYNLAFNLYDTAGNHTSTKPKSHRGLLIDNSGPGGTLLAPTNGSTVNKTVTLSFDITDDSGVGGGYAKLLNTATQQALDSALVANADGTWKAVFDTTKLADGTYRVDIRPTDVFGTARYGANKATLIIDNKKPTITVNVLNNAINPDAISVTGTDNIQLKQVTGHIYNETNTTLVKNCSTNVAALSVQNYTLTCTLNGLNLADGIYTIRSNASDMAGQISNTNSTVRFIIDTQAPAQVTGLSAFSSGGQPITNGVTRDYTVIFKWNPIADAAKYEYCYWNDIVTSQFRESNCYTTYPASPSTSGVFNQGEGVHFVKVRAIDAAGNKGAWSDAVRVFYLEHDANVTGSNFNTHSGTDYSGINVGFNLQHFSSVTGVTVQLYADDVLLDANTHNQLLLDLIHNGTNQLSTPFVVLADSYQESYWNLGNRVWAATDPAPTRAVITVTGLNTAGETVTKSATVTDLAEPNGWTFAGLVQRLTFDKDKENVLGATDSSSQPSSPSPTPTLPQQTPRQLAAAAQQHPGSDSSANPAPQSGVVESAATNQPETTGKNDKDSGSNSNSLAETASGLAIAWYWWVVLLAVAVTAFAGWRNWQSYKRQD